MTNGHGCQQPGPLPGVRGRGLTSRLTCFACRACLLSRLTRKLNKLKGQVGSHARLVLQQPDVFASANNGGVGSIGICTP
jgi:hypothetical protein